MGQPLFFRRRVEALLLVGGSSPPNGDVVRSMEKEEPILRGWERMQPERGTVCVVSSSGGADSVGRPRQPSLVVVPRGAYTSPVVGGLDWFG